MSARQQAVFRRCANAASRSMGSPWAFTAALLLIMLWLASGPIFHFSDTWQLVINTGTTIITFLMVFLIQNTQNRDAVAMHLKLDELIRALKGARNNLVDLEELSDEEIKKLQEEFRKLGADRSHERTRRAPRIREHAANRAAMEATLGEFSGPDTPKPSKEPR